MTLGAWLADEVKRSLIVTLTTVNIRIILISHVHWVRGLSDVISKVLLPRERPAIFAVGAGDAPVSRLKIRVEVEGAAADRLREWTLVISGALLVGKFATETKLSGQASGTSGLLVAKAAIESWLT